MNRERGKENKVEEGNKVRKEEGRKEGVIARRPRHYRPITTDLPTKEASPKLIYRRLPSHLRHYPPSG